MAWTAADARFQENLAAARVYYQEHWTLCAPRSAAALDKPIGQWLSNLRRPCALAEHPEWEAALKEIGEDWNPSWPADWQRHYAALRELVRDEEGATEVLPGFTIQPRDPRGKAFSACLAASGGGGYRPRRLLTFLLGRQSMQVDDLAADNVSIQRAQVGSLDRDLCMDCLVRHLVDRRKAIV